MERTIDDRPYGYAVPTICRDVHCTSAEAASMQTALAPAA
jgi:hypothetical protein